MSETRASYSIPGCDDRSYRVTVRGAEATYLVRAADEDLAYRLVLDQEAWITKVRRAGARRQGWAFAAGAADIEVEEETK